MDINQKTALEESTPSFFVNPAPPIDLVKRRLLLSSLALLMTRSAKVLRGQWRTR
jgi:hypothetical protein